MEFYDVHFSYIDNETLEETFVSVKEQGGGSLIPEGTGKPGFIHTIGQNRALLDQSGEGLGQAFDLDAF
mgnify:CR=1 FL=1